MKPTINVSAKDPRMAMYAHVLGLIAAAIAVIFGLLGLFSGNVLSGLVSLLLSIFVLVVEMDYIVIEPLKDPLVRGVAWIILAVIGAGAGEWTTLGIVISGILYIVYKYQ